MTWAAVVPMRGGSERVPGKNLRPLAGRPLYTYILDALGAARHVGSILVDSDSREILDAVAATHPDVGLRLRPAELGEGHVSMNAVLSDLLEHLPGERILQTHSTNPFLQAATIDAACQHFEQRQARSMFSVTPLQTRLWSREGQPLNHDPEHLVPTQDLEPVMEENSCLYLFTRDEFLATGNRLGSAPAIFEMDAAEAIDIDTETDWAVAAALMEAR